MSKKEEPEEKKSGLGKLEKLDRWATALMAIPILGIIIKMAFEKLGVKGAEKLTNKLETILGLNTKSAGTNVTDEIIYAAALYSTEAALTSTERETIDTFEIALRGKDAKKATAFVLFIAQIVVQFKQEVTHHKKETNAPLEEESFNDFSKGFALAGEFFKELLKRRNDEDKIAFLQGKNVFSLIPAEKTPLLNMDEIKKVATNMLTEISKNGKASQTDLQRNLTTLRDHAKTWRDAAPRRK